MKSLVVGTALVSMALLATAPSLAADASRFDGYYAGVFVGLGSVGYEGHVDDDEIVDNDPEDAEIFSGDYETGLIGGFYAGASAVSGDVVYGLEAALTLGKIQAYTEDEDGDDFATQDFRSLVTFSGRVGYAVTEETLLYGSAGIGLLTTDFHAYNNQDDIDGDDGSALYTLPGVVVAAGVEQAITENFAIRAEASYFKPSGQRDFEDDELTDDMNEGDYGTASGLFRLIVGAGYTF